MPYLVDMINDKGAWDSTGTLVEFTNSRYLRSRGIKELTLASNHTCIVFSNGKKENPVSTAVKIPGLMGKDCSYILVNTDAPLSLDIPFVCLNKSRDYVKGSVRANAVIKSRNAVRADILGNDASMESGTSVFGTEQAIAIMKPIVEAVAKDALSGVTSEELHDDVQSANRILMYSLVRKSSSWYDKGLDVEFVSASIDPTDFERSQIELRKAQNAAAVRNAEYLAAKNESEARIRLEELRKQEEESIALIGLRSDAQIQAAKDEAAREEAERAQRMERAKAEHESEIRRILNDREIGDKRKAKIILDIELEMREKLFEADLAEERRKFALEMERREAEKDLRIKEAMEKRNIDEKTIANILDIIGGGPIDDINDEGAADIPESIINEINKARELVRMAPIKGRRRSVIGTGINVGDNGVSVAIQYQPSRWRLYVKGGCTPVDVNFCDFIAIVREHVDGRDEVAIYSDSGQRCNVKMVSPPTTISSKPLVIIGNGNMLHIMAGRSGLTELNGNMLDAGKVQELWSGGEVRHGSLELKFETLRCG